MITRIIGENYKAFDYFDLEIKPLTILLGANSCGKSSLLNIILMMSQSCESIEIADVPLRINGSRVGLGEPINIIRNKDNRNKLSLTFFYNSNLSEKRYITEYSREMLRFYSITFNLLLKRLKNHSFETYKKYNKYSSDFDGFYMPNSSKEHYKIIIDEIIPSLKFIIPECKKYNITDLPSPIKWFLRNYNESELDYIINKFHDITSLENLAVNSIKYEFKINEDSKNIDIESVSLLNGNNSNIFSIKKKNKSYEFDSPIFELNNYPFLSERLKREINFDSLDIINENHERTRFSFSESRNGVLFYIKNYLAMNINILIDLFKGKNINHVSPLRAFPQRYYLLDKAIQHEQLDALNGIELAEILKKNEPIIIKINDLFKEFNIKIRTEKVNNIIHSILVNQDFVELELTDVGFGISQVLPILVQAYLSPKGSITIIEQPEIHLNPRMQAWLTDALISIALSENKKFIIETHSETLIRRIRLGIAEKKHKLKPTDVIIYNLEKEIESNSVTLKTAEINLDGDIIWPEGFMDINAQDIMELHRIKFENKNKEVH